MANTGKPISELGIDTLSDRLKDSFTNNKPDFRELDLGSPVSPLRTTRTSGPAPSSLTTTTTTTTTTTSSSSSSSGSFSGRKNDSNPVSKGHSGELTGSTESTPRTRPGHKRSDSCGSTGSHPLIYSGGGGSTVNSPPLNVLPTGNICPPGRALKTGMAAARPVLRPDVLGLGTGNYGHGSIMRSGNVAPRSGEMLVGGGGGGDPVKRAISSSDPEEVKRLGNEQYKRGHFTEALSLYDRAIELSPGNAAYRSNRAAAWTGLGRVGEAVRDCEDAVKLDPDYGRAHLRLGSLLIRLGQVDVARKHLFYAGHQPEATELHKLQAVEKHLNRCFDARKFGDWKSALREGDAAIAAGADYSPQLFSCRAESLLKLQQLDDIDSILSHIPKVEPSPNCCSQSKFFGMLSEAYLFYVRAQIEMAFGRFENAVTCAEKAGKIDPRNIEVAKLLNNVRLVARARARGNDLFKSERFTEACAAYGEGLKLDPSNSVLFCNRAACWFKLGMWEKSIEDCNSALRIHPNYTKALLRRAASNSKLEQWAEAVRDYEFLRKKLPQDTEVAEALFHAQVALKKSRGEEVFNMKFGGDVEEILTFEQFRATISSPGVSVIHFEIPSNPQCKRISSFLDMLCGRYPSINFLKVNVEEIADVATAENVRIVPTFKIYKNGGRVKEIVNPTSDVLEATVRHYSL
ncbi:TPR repeat-containing thioredoxin TTL1-like [Chenopodium quinoa]|nr:TPR repeat-containing thioredoxin TTL1-like [Chenopodium quinoa]